MIRVTSEDVLTNATNLGTKDKDNGIDIIVEVNGWMLRRDIVATKKNYSRTLSDGKSRLREWISYNLMLGFDHVVVYDNTAATGLSGNETLKVVTDLFDSTKVTHVNWPCKICNNNRPNHKNPRGEIITIRR